jgi:hypothetical protein
MPNHPYPGREAELMLSRAIGMNPPKEKGDVYILLECAEQLENYSFHEHGKELRRIASRIAADPSYS